MSQNLHLAQDIFEYKEHFALKNIFIAFRTALYVNKQNTAPEDLIKTLEIDIPLPKFFMLLDTEIDDSDITTLIQELKKSPTQLQKSPISWVYYSLYFALNLGNRDPDFFHNNDKIKAILLLVLKYHIAYLTYKKKSKIQQNSKFFEESTLTFIRMIEYLIAFDLSDNDELDNKYFTNLNELDINFLSLAGDLESLEKNHFFIKNDPKMGNFLVYENSDLGIHLQIESSRMLRQGEASLNDFYNNNITRYFNQGREYYFKIMTLQLKTSDGSGAGGNHGPRSAIQSTEEEEFLRGVKRISMDISANFALEEVTEVLAQAKLTRRTFPTKDDKQDAPNLYKQYLRNKAFSANITKRTLLLSPSYDILPLPILSGFLQYLSLKPFGVELVIEDVYRTIFLVDCALGIGFLKIIQIFSEDTKNIKLDNSYLKHKIDTKLFSKETNSYLQKVDKEIIYRVPHGLLLLINKTKSYFRELSDKEKKEFYKQEEAQKYFVFIKNQIKNYPKQIQLDPNQTWKIADSLRKTLFYEDMSTLFCIGRYQQNDTPRLAYASTNKRGQNHSKLLEMLYTKLDMHLCVAALLNIKPSVLESATEFNDSVKYAGSNKVVCSEKSKYFFNRIKSLLRYEQNEEKYFNLASIYTRYALSLLLGTRSFEYSASMDRVSFSTHTLVISEKSQTLLSGVRVIPLCERAKEMIQSYQQLCENYNIPSNNIYLIHDNKTKIYKQGQAYEILKSYNLEDELVNFVKLVPLNTGRHAITKLAMETNFNLYYLETFMGHFIAGGEQIGIYSTLNMQDYLQKTRELTAQVAKIYGV